MVDEVRLARPAEAEAICDVCREGFTASAEGLLTAATVRSKIREYYDPARVRHEIETAGATDRWQGYVVAVSASGDVLGAAGGGVSDGAVGHLYVLYLRLALRGRGIGSALLEFVTAQQRAAGATEQWVSVTEGNDLGIPFYLARGFTVRDRVPFATTADGAVEACSLRMSRAV